jgi:hypothetical protein
MRRVVSIASVGLLAFFLGEGCASSAQSASMTTTAGPEYEPALDPIIGRSWVMAIQAYVTPTCNKQLSDAPSESGDPPALHQVSAGGGITVRQSCGLIYHEVFTPEYTSRFARDVCGITDEKIDDNCSKQFMDMFFARLGERYVGADWNAVAQHCRAYPLECTSALEIEQQLVKSHNAGVRAWYDNESQLALAQARYQAAQQAQLAAQQQELAERRSVARRRAFFEAMGAMGKAMAPPLQP